MLAKILISEFTISKKKSNPHYSELDQNIGYE